MAWASTISHPGASVPTPHGLQYRSSPTTSLAGPHASVWENNRSPPGPSGDASSPSPDGSHARRDDSHCISPSAGHGNRSSVAPSHDCEPFHSLTDHRRCDPSIRPPNRLAVSRQAGPRVSLAARQPDNLAPAPPLLALNIPSAGLPHPPPRSIYRYQRLTVSLHASHPFADRHGFILSVDPGLDSSWFWRGLFMTVAGIISAITLIALDVYVLR